jgi:hypothetical protein
MRNAYIFLVGKPEGIHRRRWKDNINTYFEGTGCKGVDWIHLAQNRAQWSDLKLCSETSYEVNLK